MSTEQMRPNRRVMSVLLLALTVVLGACGSATSSSSSSSSSKPTLRLGLVLPDLTNQTINDIYLGAQAQAKKLGNVTILEGGTSNTSAWLSACQRIVASNIQILAYDTLDAVATSTCIQQANSMGIKTICIFACTAKGTSNALVSLDFENDGVLIGTWMATALNGHGNVGFLEGPPGDMAAAAIATGFRTSLAAKCPACVLVEQVPGGTTTDTGYTIGLEVLTAHPNINAMYGLNDDIALGIVKAVQQDGKTGQILVAGHNGTCQAFEAILNKTLDFTVLLAGQPFGIDVVNAALTLRAGGTVGTVNATAVAVDSQTAQGVLNGTIPDNTAVNLKARLVAAQGGCKTSE